MELNNFYWKLFFYQFFLFGIISSISLIVGVAIDNFFPILITNSFGLALIFFYNIILFITNVKFKVSLTFFSSFRNSVIRIIVSGLVVTSFVIYMSYYDGSWGISFSDTYNVVNFYIFLVYISIPTISTLFLLRK